MKKTLLITISIAVVLLLSLSLSLSGCKTTGTSETTAAATQTETTAAAETTAAETQAAGEKPNLIFWQNEAGSGLSQWYKDVAADINANEDFTIEIVENPIADVITKLTAAGVSQSGFDITWDWSGTMSTLARGTGGIYQPINKIVGADVLDKLSPDTRVANTDESGNLYGAPFFLETCYMAYNKQILEKAGIDVNNIPTEFNAWMDMMEKIKASGVIPISFANKEGLVHEFWVMDMMSQYFNDTAAHKQSWMDAKFSTAPEWKDVMEKYKAMYDKKYLDPEGETLDYASNYFSRFSSGRVAAIWFINSLYASTIKEGEIGDANVVYGKLPFMGTAALKESFPTLGYNLAVANWTKYPEQCAIAIGYFTGEKWQKEMLKYGVVPAYQGVDISGADITPNMQFIYSANPKFTPMGYEYWVASQYDELIRSATDYLHESITFEDFAKKMEAASVSE